MFCKIDGKKIPLVTVGTSPFLGAGQFGRNAFIWRKKFLNNTNAMVEILEAGYQAGAKGIEAIPIGKIMDATRIMCETYNDYIVTGSTTPNAGRRSIKDLIQGGAQLIFVHGMVSDEKGSKLLRVLDALSSQGVIPGIATHNPIATIKYSIKNSLNVRAFLIPFNASGVMMGDQANLEQIVDDNKDYAFIGMKTLAAGKLKPEEAFDYLSKHNICAVSIGMVTKEEAIQSTNAALEKLNNKKL
ncbi:MAG: hypothetical protein ACTSR8_07865 [Promethearchaeota archaeon]